MMPSEEEKSKILEAQMSTPEIPLGNAEQFLLTLSSITELEARLKLWAFKLDYETTESVRKLVDLIYISMMFSLFKCLKYGTAVIYCSD